jgi:Mg-chelatase subunit ChlD
LKPKIVVILDRSGSMGQWCHRAASQCIPDALKAIGYGDKDRIVLITFDSQSERVKVNGQDPSVLELRGLNIAARGSTNMVQVIGLLQAELAGSKEPHHIIVLSDGGVGDQEQTSKLAAQVAAGLKPNYRISCSLIRFISSVCSLSIFFLF